MVKCDFCGKEDYLPFKCRYCNGYFCAEHRLPENHNCSKAYQAPKKERKTKKEPREMEKESQEEDVEKDIVPRRIVQGRSVSRLGKLSTSKTEVAHLFAATVLILAVVFSSLIFNVIWIFTSGLGGFVFGTLIWLVFSGSTWLLSYIPGLSNFLTFFQIDNVLWLGLIVIASFLLHELSHKLVAQMYNLWAEFRIVLFGIFFTILSIFTFLKFLAPGAVMISGPSDLQSMGKTSISGPLVNLALGASLFVLSFLFPNLHVQSLFSQVNLSYIMIVGASINANLGLFNMSPVPPFDGYKVWQWSKRIWIVTFASLVAFLIVTLLVFQW